MHRRFRMNIAQSHAIVFINEFDFFINNVLKIDTLALAF